MRGTTVAIILVSVSLIVSCLGLEAGVRIWQGVSLTTTGNFIIPQLDLIRQNSRVVDYDPLLGWRLKANIFSPGSGFTSGDYGLRMNRNDEIRPPALGGVLAVGDSFTAGSGVDDRESWPAQLEALINQSVNNGAAGGWGVDQMVLRAEQLVLELRPKVLIVSILAQDSFRNNFEIYGGGYKPYFVIENGTAVLKGTPVPLVAQRSLEIGPVRKVIGHSYLIHWAMMRLKPTAWVQESSRYKKIHADEVGVQISCHLMDRLKRLQDQHGLHVIVAMQYGAVESSGKEPPWYGPPVLECAKQRGFDILDTYLPLKAIADQDQPRFIGLWLNEGGQLGHMSAAGNRLIAELLRDILINRTYVGSKGQEF